MGIEQQLNEDLKTAMRARDQQRVACIRQVKAKVQGTVNDPEFDGKTDDAFYQQQIAGYVKSLQKGIQELEAAGDKGAQLRASYGAEIEYLSTYLPKMLDEAATRNLVRDAIASLGITDAKQSGRVIGAVMKDHKGEVDAQLVGKLARELLER